MGWFKNEIVPVTTTIANDQGKEETITVLQDEGVRPGTTLEGLAKLKPAFKEDGTTTAGTNRQGVKPQGRLAKERAPALSRSVFHFSCFANH